MAQTFNALRDGGAINKAYNLLKDGKVRKVSDLKKTLQVNRPYGLLYRLCRILRAHNVGQLDLSKVSGTVQLVKIGTAPKTAAVKTKTAAKPKTVAPKAQKVKTAAKPKVAVTSIASDDDIMEE